MQFWKLLRSKNENATKDGKGSFRELTFKELPDKEVKQIKAREKELGRKLEQSEMWAFLVLQCGKKIIIDETFRQTILSKYAGLVANRNINYGRKSDLPLDDFLIRRAIIIELLNFPDEKYRNSLEVLLVELESFLSNEEFKEIEPFYKFLRNSKETNFDGKELAIKLKHLGLSRANEISQKTSERMYDRGNQMHALKEFIKI